MLTSYYLTKFPFFYFENYLMTKTDLMVLRYNSLGNANLVHFLNLGTLVHPSCVCMQADPGHLERPKNYGGESRCPIVPSSATWIVFWPLDLTSHVG
jgi:hypothetical protein